MTTLEYCLIAAIVVVLFVAYRIACSAAHYKFVAKRRADAIDEWRDLTARQTARLFDAMQERAEWQRRATQAERRASDRTEVN